MATPHRARTGATVSRCADENACTVYSCAVCLKEVPADAVSVTDAQEYVHHFCGLDCLAVWRRRAAAEEGPTGSDQLK